jgi:hypothetical protein
MNKDNTSTKEQLLQTSVDAIHATTQVLAALTPITAIFHATFVKSPMEKRLQQQLDALAEELEILKRQNGQLTEEYLVNHPIFSGAVAQILMLSMAEPIEEKRKIYRNMALNTVVNIDIEADMKIMFIGMMDEFTASHIRLIMLFNHPDWMEQLDMKSNWDNPHPHLSDYENMDVAMRSIGFHHITEQMVVRLEWLGEDIFFARRLLLDLIHAQILVLPTEGFGSIPLRDLIGRPATSSLGAKFAEFAASPIAQIKVSE